METQRVVGASGFSALPTGTVLERYRIEHVIAAGGFGITYLCRHTGLDATFALKEHFPRQCAYRDAVSSGVQPSDPDTFTWALDRFLQEGKALAQCRHPNVVSVADVFEANGTAYLALGYEDGTIFKNWLDALGRPMTQAEIDRLLVPLLDALEYVHGQGLLHRDIAPDNIMIRSDGSPCLIDFGAARQAVAERSQMMSAIVKSGFSPPEQYTRSGRAQGPWSDIYALGATLYRAVTGKTPQESTERQLDDDLVPAREAVKAPDQYRASFLTGIDAALRLRYADRPQSIKALRALLLGQSPTVAELAETKPVGRSAADDLEPRVRAVTFSELKPAVAPVSLKRFSNGFYGVIAAVLVSALALWWAVGQKEAGRVAPALPAGEAPAARSSETEAQRRAEEERVRAEAQKQAEDDRARGEAQRRAEEERARVAAQKRADEERARAEAKKRADDERAKAEAQQRAEEERARIEAQRRAEEERARVAAQKRADEERAKAEAQRRVEEERARIEAQRRAEEERARAEAQKLAEEERARAEAQRRASEEYARAEAQKRAEEERARAEAQKRADEERARIEAQKRAEDERARAEAQRRYEEERARVAAQKRADEERARAEAQKRAGEERAKAEAQKRAEEERVRSEAFQRKARVPPQGADGENKTRPHSNCSCTDVCQNAERHQQANTAALLKTICDQCRAKCGN